MLASSIVFFPRLRGTSQRARSPLGAQAYSGASDVFVPISSTKTSRLWSSARATNTRQAILKNSSRSEAPTRLFFGSTPCA